MDVSIRPTRRPFDALALAEASLYSADLIGGFSVHGGRSFRLRGTTPDPLDAGAKPGRDSDILFEGRVFPVVSNFTVEESQRASLAVLARWEATPGRTLRDGSAGRLVKHGPIKVMHRCCRQCGEPFKQWRFATQRRRWSTFCCADHRTAHKRVADRERQRKRRSA
ncbi:hypothetical protein ACGFY0_03680 [Streptomyces chartreusis]|uniref:hypothetical protein n=1 Tax=Streptomyces chartreusis TaxID=1969 RepID=UPI00371054F0